MASITSGLEADNNIARALPLLIAARGQVRVDLPFPVDRIRMQKAVFLAAVGGPAPWRGGFEYRPYNWGPYSSSLDAAIGELTGAGLIRMAVPMRSRYGAYVPTQRGEVAADVLWGTLSPEAQVFVDQTVLFVRCRTFNRLLQDVYAAYPEYATKSRFHSRSTH